MFASRRADALADTTLRRLHRLFPAATVAAAPGSGGSPPIRVAAPDLGWPSGSPSASAAAAQAGTVTTACPDVGSERADLDPAEPAGLDPAEPAGSGRLPGEPAGSATTRRWSIEGHPPYRRRFVLDRSAAASPSTALRREAPGIAAPASAADHPGPAAEVDHELHLDPGADPTVRRWGLEQGADPRFEQSRGPTSEPGLESRFERGLDSDLDPLVDPTAERDLAPLDERGLESEPDRFFEQSAAAGPARGADPRFGPGHGAHLDRRLEPGESGLSVEVVDLDASASAGSATAPAGLDLDADPPARADRWFDRSARLLGLRRALLDPGRRGLRAIAVLAAVVVVAAGVVAWRLRPVADPVEPPTMPVAASAARTSASAGAELVVSVVGKVRHPGVVRVPAGSRVADAIQAAGGALAGADLGMLNQARRLVDGEQIAVGVTPPPGAGGVGAAPGGSANPTAKVNLNTATPEQLDTLPGVGPTLSARIIAFRTEHGGFRSIEELKQVSGIGDARYADIKDLVTV